MLDGSGPITSSCQTDSQIEVGLWILRLQLQRRMIVLDGVIQLALFRQNVGQIIVGLRVIGIDSQ